MTRVPRISVVVATYDWPAALDRVLASLDEQTYSEFEVIVADDGSGPETAALVESWKQRASFPLRHVWQEDEGFRAAAVRNRAVAASDGGYIVFLDADCLVRPDFLARHARLSAAGHFVAGNRVLLSPAFTERIVGDGLTVANWTAGRWLAERLRGGIKRWWPLLRMPPGAWRDRAPNAWRGAKTCNLAIWRDDFVAVNGLDERYAGWGYEDSDLVIRLIRYGVRRRDGRLGTTVLHLWHEETAREGTEANLARLAEIRDGTTIRAEIGLNQYL